jgi:hypothetical protein
VRYVQSPQHRREVKPIADTVMEQEILAGLAEAQRSVLSEESGYTASQQNAQGGSSSIAWTALSIS